MSILNNTIDLTPTESRVFGVLSKTNTHYNLGVTLRCAGGWVRDKLLGRQSDDIDIALDTMLGAAFAEKVNAYLSSQGEEVHEIAVIETNPEQSKHLETARVKIHGVQIDLVNLRCETYTQTSRVPQITFGSPKEDAYRRDLTINALFYNINEGVVEDFTEQGLDDLKSGYIRTPLSPLETFQDDPLRVLRSIRFAARFAFRVDEALLQAATSESVRDALRLKVSRERIGTEVEGMLKGPDPLLAIQHLIDLSLFPLIFILPENLHLPNYGPMCLATLQAAVQILQAKGHDLTTDERRLYLLAALLIPIRSLKGPPPPGKGSRSSVAATSHVIWDGLRWKNKDSVNVGLLHDHIPQLLALYTRQLDPSLQTKSETHVFEGNQMRVDLGLWIRRMKALWKIGVLLAPTFTLQESLSTDGDSHNSPSRSFVQEFNTAVSHEGRRDLSEKERETKRVELCDELRQFIADYGLEDAWELKPSFDGKFLMSELKIARAGPVIGELLSWAMKWQLAYPDGSKADCLSFLKEQYQNERAEDSKHENK